LKKQTEIEKNVLSVSEITGLIKQTLEENFYEINVIGEISNYKAHVSGHWYFTLKDSGAQISCTMWRGVNNYVFFAPQDGMKVVITGRLTLYAPRGSYQIDVRSMKPAGEGELQAAFEKLKKKLAAEGLFDEKYKKPIPKYPAKIGIVTAIDGAAFQDMKSIASRRYPLVELVIASCKVQGENAAEDIAKNIKLLNLQKDIDLIIVGRGGGSLEDLWAFNEEIVARAIFDSELPVISAVGHEIDFTISDFVADLRAATPSAAMELATPDKDELFAFIDEFSYYFPEKMTEIISGHRDEIRKLLSSYGFRLPQDMISGKSQYLDSLVYRFQNIYENKLSVLKNQLTLLESKLQSHDIENVLRKGFSIVKQNGKYVPRLKNFKEKDAFDIKFFDGEVKIK